MPFSFVTEPPPCRQRPNAAFKEPQSKRTEKDGLHKKKKKVRYFGVEGLNSWRQQLYVPHYGAAPEPRAPFTVLESSKAGFPDAAMHRNHSKLTTALPRQRTSDRFEAATADAAL